MTDVHIKGVQKVSLIDYPGKVSAIVFLNKCNMRCPFCHNPELVFNNDSGGDYPDIPVEEFMQFLNTKKKWIDGVSVCGGEPTMHPGLPEFLKEIKKKGLLVKLDTNGTHPNMLRDLIDQRLVDYVAMDVKNSETRYADTTRVKVNLEKVKESIKMVIEAGKKGDIDYEFRATVLPKLHDKESVEGIAQLIDGAKIFYLQKFKTEASLVDDSFRDAEIFLDPQMEELREVMLQYVERVEFR